jgi:hypothetical protein
MRRPDRARAAIRRFLAAVRVLIRDGYDAIEYKADGQIRSNAPDLRESDS